MDELVVGLFSDRGDLRIVATRDLSKTLRNAHDRRAVVAPVFAVKCDGGMFAQLFGFDRLPVIVPADGVAGFGGAVLAPEAQRESLRHLSRLGPSKAVPLLQSWARAVKEAA